MHYSSIQLRAWLLLQALMASSENPMLLLETPQGPGGRQRGWNPDLQDLNALPRHTSSCPATPQDTLRRARGGSPVREAFPLTGARSEQAKADTWYGTSGKIRISGSLRPHGDA